MTKAGRTSSSRASVLCLKRAVSLAVCVLLSGVPGAVEVLNAGTLQTQTFFASICFGPETNYIELEGNYLISCQIQDVASTAYGCFNDVVPGSGATWVVPRENGTAILGLIEAYSATGQAKYRTAALLGADYLARRQESDGSWCNKYDEVVGVSTDSNKSPSQAGSAIMAFTKIKAMGWANGLHRYDANVRKAAEYLMACIDHKPGAANGLCGAGKEYGAGYTGGYDAGLGNYRWSDWSWISDNCYAYIGLMCAKEWAMENGDGAFARSCDRYAATLLTGINTVMKDTGSPVWFRVVGGNGELVSESLKKDALCYYPQKYDLPVPQYGNALVGLWMRDNLQVIAPMPVSDGFGAFVWGESTDDPLKNDRRSQGFSMEAWLALADIPGSFSADTAQRAKNWWEAADNKGDGGGKLWDLTNGGIVDWYDPDGSPDGFVAENWQKFIDTSANCIFVYRGGYNHNIAATMQQPPLIEHRPLEKLWPLTSVVTVTGTVTCDGQLSSVSVYYRTDAQADCTKVTKGSGEYFGLNYANFSFDLPVDLAGASQFYYTIEAVDANGTVAYLPGGATKGAFTVAVTSTTSSTVGSAGGTVTASAGSGTSLIIPPGALDAPTPITITQLDPADPGVASGNFMAKTERPVSLFHFEPEGLTFKKMVTMSLMYPDADQDGIIDGTPYREDDLKIFWWDGIEWRLVGGTVDPVANVVTWQVNHFSIYALFPAAALTDEAYRPRERIITPALADGINDLAVFTGLAAGDVVNIYDVNGRRVRQLRDDFRWNGRDEDNALVESGVYVYQIKVAGRTISGTIVVAK